MLRGIELCQTADGESTLHHDRFDQARNFPQHQEGMLLPRLLAYVHIGANKLF